MTEQHRAPDAPRKRGHRRGARPPEAESADSAPDAVDADSEQGPERRCIVSGVVGPKERLLRFVVGPGQEVVPDIDERLPGRGLWLSARRDMVETATAKRAFSRAARQAVIAPPDLADRIEALLRARCRNLVGLARRAGLVVAGSDQVRAAGREGKVALLLEAAEGAADGRRKVMAAAPGAPVADSLTGADLASALGRDHVIHVAVLAGTPAQRPLVGRLRQELDRLAAYVAPADMK